MSEGCHIKGKFWMASAYNNGLVIVVEGEDVLENFFEDFGGEGFGFAHLKEKWIITKYFWLGLVVIWSDY